MTYTLPELIQERYPGAESRQYRKREIWSVPTADLDDLRNIICPDFDPPHGRTPWFGEHQGSLVAYVDHEPWDTEDDPEFEGFVLLHRPRIWRKEIRPLSHEQAAASRQKEEAVAEFRAADLDNLIRYVHEPNGAFYGWFLRTRNGTWTKPSASAVVNALWSMYPAVGQPDIRRKTGEATLRPWTVTSEPFAPDEDPDRRTVNAEGAKLRATSHCDDWRAECPNWLKILSHVGEDITVMHQRGTADMDGPEWLHTWMAAIIQQPYVRLPYIYLWGPQDSGKSILYESFELLVTRGVVNADRPLGTQTTFNGELLGAVLCAVEEIDITESPAALARLKSYTTSLNIPIRQMHKDTYMMRNSTHWIQCANDRRSCPIMVGDSRVQSLYVAALPKDAMIPKIKFLPMLTEEAPKFAYSLLHKQLPEADGRLLLPIYETDHHHDLRQLPPFVEALQTVLGNAQRWEGSLKELNAIAKSGCGDLRVFMRSVKDHQEMLDQLKIRVDRGGRENAPVIVLSLIP